MPDHALYAAIAAAVIATFGLWWLRVVLPVVKEQPKASRYGIYALVWSAYFVLTMMVIAQAQS